MKTMQEWESSQKPFGEFAKIGDVVDVNIYDYFLCVVPPKTWTPGCLQCGEPVNINSRTGAYTYTTFLLQAGQWVYAGDITKAEAMAKTVA